MIRLRDRNNHKQDRRRWDCFSFSILRRQDNALRPLGITISPRVKNLATAAH